MRRATLLLAGTVLLLWPLAGCAGGEDARGVEHQASVVDGSDRPQRVEPREKTVSAQTSQPAESVDVDDNWASKLVFQSWSGELWAMNARGSQPLRLTQKGKSYPSPSLSPDGQKITFATERTVGGCGGASACASTTPEKTYAQIYVMNADGSDQTLLAEESGASSSPTWSPDGERIAYALPESDDGNCTIYATNADGSGHRRALVTLEGCYSINSLSWSPDGKKIAFEGSTSYNAFDIWVVDVAGAQEETRRPRQLTHTPRTWWNVGPTWSPDSSEIAFTHKHTEGYEQNIHKINADGSGEIRLTRDPALYRTPTDDPPVDPSYFPMYSPVYSPDGTKIAFVRGYRHLENPDPYAGSSSNSSLLYVMNSDGSNPTVVKDFSLEQVTPLDWLSGDVDLPLTAPDLAQGEPAPPTDGCKPVESPGGEITFQKGEDIWTMSADGSNQTQLTHERAREETPAFSPDGRKIAFVKEVEVEAEGGSLSETPPHLVDKVVVMDANGCDQVVLPVPEGKGALDPSWSPDGERVVFGTRGFLSYCGIYITDADGSGAPRHIPTPGISGCVARPEWSPDGSQIAFEGYSQDGWADIYLVDVTPEGATSRPQRLPIDDDLLYAEDPSWSPDGTEIAFNSRGDIYKTDIDTLEETRLTNGADTEYSPTWSPDGEKIAYVRDTGNSSSLYVVASDGSSSTLLREFTFGRLSPDWRALP